MDNSGDRRAFRRGAEEVAEPAEDMGADGFPFVLGEHHPRGTLTRVDVEMVEPEIGEHLLELPIAVDGAQEFLLR